MFSHCMCEHISSHGFRIQCVFSDFHVSILRTVILWRFSADAARSVVLWEMFLGFYHNLHMDHMLRVVSHTKSVHYVHESSWKFMKVHDVSCLWPKSSTMVFVLSIEVGMAGTSIDICLDAKAFDLTGPSAFGSLGCYLISGTYPCIWLQYELHIYIAFRQLFRTWEKSYRNTKNKECRENQSHSVWSFLGSMPSIRLVLNEVMRCKPGSTVVPAPDCRSLSKMFLGHDWGGHVIPVDGFNFSWSSNFLTGWYNDLVIQISLWKWNQWNSFNTLSLRRELPFWTSSVNISRFWLLVRISMKMHTWMRKNIQVRCLDAQFMISRKFILQRLPCKVSAHKRSILSYSNGKSRICLRPGWQYTIRSNCDSGPTCCMVWSSIHHRATWRLLPRAPATLSMALFSAEGRVGWVGRNCVELQNLVRILCIFMWIFSDVSLSQSIYLLHIYIYHTHI